MARQALAKFIFVIKKDWNFRLKLHSNSQWMFKKYPKKPPRFQTNHAKETSELKQLKPLLTARQLGSLSYLFAERDFVGNIS